MSVLTIVRSIALVCAGLLAGVYLDHMATAPARATLSASGFIEYQQVVHEYYVWMMPILIFSGLLSGLIWLVLVKSQWRGTEFWLVAAALIGIIFIIVITRVVNAPLNNQLMTWSITDPPANLREIWAPWERANSIRAVVGVGVLILEAMALTSSAQNVRRGTAFVQTSTRSISNDAPGAT